MSDWYAVHNVDQVASPAVLVYPDRIAENLRRMIAAVGGPDRLRPHVKTHKLPQIIAMKLQAGIRKFKVATIAEAEMTAAAGGRDILLAYQPVGPNVSRMIELIRRFPETHFAALVDHRKPLLAMSAAACQANVILTLYLDLDVGMHRTGIPPGDAAWELYQVLTRAPHLQAAGLHAYDGHLHQSDPSLRRESAEMAFAPIWQLCDRICAAGLERPKIIASGTPTFSMLAQHEGVEVGCGTTVLWDFGQLITTPDLDFLNAAVLLTRVISMPGEHRLCLDLGHKAIAAEMPQPRMKFLGLEDATPVMQSEEHLVIETTRAVEFAPGDVLYAIPRHICPTVALHHEVQVVRESRVVEQWPVVARTRKISI